MSIQDYALIGLSVVLIIIIIISTRLWIKAQKLKRKLLAPLRLFGSARKKAKKFTRNGITLSSKTYNKILPMVKDAYNHPKVQKQVNIYKAKGQKELDKVLNDPVKYAKDLQDKYAKDLQDNKKVKVELKTLPKPKKKKQTKGKL